MDGIALKQYLNQNKRAYGTAILTASPLWPPMVKKTGVDFVFIDSEHIALDRSQLSWMCRTYSALGMPPLVRIPSPDPYQACQVLDGGAVGLIAPYIESPEQVRDLVGAVKFRPLKGRRLDSFLRGDSDIEPALLKYLESKNQRHILLINIESQPALDQLEAILSVPGLDGVLIGPHDLSCSLGIPEQYDHPEFQTAIRTIIQTARSKGLIAGNHFCEDINLHTKWAKFGENLIIRSNDLYLFSRALKQELNTMKHDLGDSLTTDDTHDDLVI
ncbi:aldolase/citrate lyase family protein [Verrucomicrobia bacterium]|nr:aldolase/citrate lyase family protein [Verrucomicrobiota bacterium]